jgi:hypothetical protein
MDIPASLAILAGDIDTEDSVSHIRTDTGHPTPSSTKIKRALAIGIALWVFMMILFLAMAIAIDWQ